MKNSKTENLTATLSLVTAVLIFGTVGIFRRYIPLPSASISFVRAVVASVFLIVFMTVRRELPSRDAIRRNIIPLCLSGAFLGLNWILLFESYNYTTVSCATLCYYTAPVYVALLSPIVLGDRITPVKLCCTVFALGGMVLASGIVGDSGEIGLRGILCGLGAAMFYASVTVTNKKLKDIKSLDRSLVQICVAGIVVLPYALIAERGALTESIPQMTFLSTVMLLFVGVLHTGVAFTLYFGSLMRLKAQTAALLSYIDPVSALVLSAMILNENMSVLQTVGAVLVIGSAAVGELLPSDKDLKKNKKEDFEKISS